MARKLYPSFDLKTGVIYFYNFEDPEYDWLFIITKIESKSEGYFLEGGNLQFSKNLINNVDAVTTVREATEAEKERFMAEMQKKGYSIPAIENFPIY